MIFKYKNLEVSKKVELNIEYIKKHKASFIRTANLRPDGSLVYNETIDNSLIELIPETTPEENMILGEISANNFYYDATRNKYLGLDTIEVSFYLDGTNKKNQFMFQIPNVTSNTMPYRLFEDYVLIGAEYYTLNTTASGADVFAIKNNANGSNLLILSNTLASPVTEFYNVNYDVTIPANTRISCAVLNVGVDAPVVKIYLKKTYKI